MIAANPIWAAKAASPRPRITAGSSGDSENRGATRSCGCARRRRVPPSPKNTTKPSASAITMATPVGSIPPSAASPTATASKIIARMSSTTAAPRIVRAGRVPNDPISIRTAEVIPMLVATSAAPMKMLVVAGSPRPRPTPTPPARGSTNPSMPTRIAARPTSASSESFVSSPTQKSRKTTPSSAKTSSVSPGSTRPITEGPIRTPARISPTIEGWFRRLKSSSPSFAASRTTKRSVRIPATGEAATNISVSTSCCLSPIGETTHGGST